MKFEERVYETVMKVPEGRVTTYKEIAHFLDRKCYQLIGQILARNPYAPTVPCHRVVKSNGEVGGFNRSSENKDKITILEKEGVRIENGVLIDFDKIFLRL